MNAGQSKPKVTPIRWRPLDELTRTKTIATVGPACADRKILVALVREGVNVFRLNMAHGTREQHQAALTDIRAAASEAETPVGVLVDLAGPKIRLGQLFSDSIQCIPGTSLTFVRGSQAAKPDELVCSYPTLLDEIRVGDWIMLRDGLVRLQVSEMGPDFARCTVVDGGAIRSRQGVNLPGVNLSVPALLQADIDNAIWAAQQAVDLVSLSFIRSAVEIERLKKLLGDHGSAALVVAKIEKREALANLESIIEVADAVMVARGDLGVEIEVEKTPLAQKQIINLCRARGKPVIVATQMLESMHDSPQPTRAEVSDVANAILDGADACMLSGETAIGQFPRQAVRMMRKVMRETEPLLDRTPPDARDRPAPRPHDVGSAVIFGAAQIARRLDARLVVIATSNGQSALDKSRQRDFIPTIAVTDRPEWLGKMSLFWGIIPMLGHSIQEPNQLRTLIHQWAHQDPRLRQGDRVVLVIDTETLPGIHDLVMVIEIEKT